MRTYTFDIPDEEDVVILDALIGDRFEYLLALDTAATHTTIDSNALYLAGYELKNAIGEVEIETSNGIIPVEIYKLVRFECMGVVKKDFEIQVYDFLAHGITSNYHGILGLDFLRHHPFCLDIGKGEIKIQ
jgi:Aspartyl protease